MRQRWLFANMLGEGKLREQNRASLGKTRKAKKTDRSLYDACMLDTSLAGPSHGGGRRGAHKRHTGTAMLDADKGEHLIMQLSLKVSNFT